MYHSVRTELLNFSKKNLQSKQFCSPREGNPANVLGTIQVLRHHVFDFFRPTHPPLWLRNTEYLNGPLLTSVEQSMCKKSQSQDLIISNYNSISRKNET